MIQQSNKIKRGQAYTVIETGDTVYITREREDGKLFACYDKSQAPGAKYELFDKIDLRALKQVNKPISKTVKVSPQKKEFKRELNVFFASQTLIMPDECENCGEPLNAYGKFFKRCVSAHILEKSKFPTVAIHPQNLIFLGSSLVDSGCQCHNLFDEKGAEYRSQMKCYHLVIERFNQFKHLLTEAELVKAYNYLNIKWE